MKTNPKRRKSKYNPYILKYLENKKVYKIKFKNFENKLLSIDVSEEIFKEFNKFELNDLSQMNEFDRHIEHSALTEITLNKRIIKKQRSVEEIVVKKLENEKLHKAILQLPTIQRRRIVLYFFKNLNLKEIAIKENVSIRAIQYTIKIALKNLKKFLN